MRVVALTGGMASGKSTALQYFKSKGASVINLDDVALEVLAPGTEETRMVTAAFGREVVGETGKIDRRALAAKAFASAEATEKLNAIVHPAVLNRMCVLVERLRDTKNPSVLIIEIPLLEKADNINEIFDEVLTISSNFDARLQRAELKGFTKADALARIALQNDDNERELSADTVIRNDGSLVQFTHLLEAWWIEHNGS